MYFLLFIHIQLKTVTTLCGTDGCNASTCCESIPPKSCTLYSSSITCSAEKVIDTSKTCTEGVNCDAANCCRPKNCANDYVCFTAGTQVWSRTHSFCFTLHIYIYISTLLAE